MGYKTKLHSFRLAEDDDSKLEDIIRHLIRTKPGTNWSRSAVVRHLIARFHEALPAEERKS